MVGNSKNESIPILSASQCPKFRALLLIVLLLSPFLCGSLRAEHGINDSIVYLYKSDFGESRDDNDGINQWAFPLMQLGFSIRTYDTLKAPPEGDGKFLRTVHGIIAPTGSWETSKRWCLWLEQRMKEGFPVLILAPLGPGDPEEDPPVEEYPIRPEKDLNRVYETLGLELDSSLYIEKGEGGAELIRWKHKEPGWFGYDKDLVQGDTPYYLKWSPVIEGVESLLTLAWEGIEGTDSVVVAFTPRGALAIEEYIKFTDFTEDETKWRINPVRFLAHAFQVEDLPRSEYNVICGNRSLLCHFGGERALDRIDDGRKRCEALVEDVFIESRRAKFPVLLTALNVDEYPSKGKSQLPTIISTNGYEDVMAQAQNIRVTKKSYPRFSDPEPDFTPDPSKVLAFPIASVPIEKIVKEPSSKSLSERIEAHRRSLMLLPTQRPEALNLFIPYYLADKEKWRQRIFEVLDWSSEQDTTAVYLDEYIQMARAGREAKIGRCDDGGYFVEQNSKLPSLRFDRRQGYPDLKRSKGVIGYHRRGDSLYIYLDEGERQEIFLSKERPKGFCLARANRPIRDLHKKGFRWIFTTRGPSRAVLDFQGLNERDTYVAELFQKGTQSIMDELSFTTDELGRGRLVIEYPGWARVEFWSTSDEIYYLVKVKRFFWRSGTLPLFIGLLIFLLSLGAWKIAGKIVARRSRRLRG